MKLRALILWFGSALVAGADSYVRSPEVALLPYGPVTKEDIATVKAGIQKLLPLTVVVLWENSLPRAAYHKPRDRYKADLLLEALEKRKPDRFVKIIGLTARDISVTNEEGIDWGIFGLGQLGGDACVVSTFRLRAGDVDEETFRARLVKVANHELGHTFGLNHCRVKGCLMQDARGKIATVDGESGKPCAGCTARLRVLRNDHVRF